MVSVSCFGVRVSVMFHFMFVHYTFSSVWVAEWPPFGKELPARLAICSHCILSICNNYYSPTLKNYSPTLKKWGLYWICLVCPSVILNL